MVRAPRCGRGCAPTIRRARVTSGAPRATGRQRRKRERGCCATMRAMVAALRDARRIEALLVASFVPAAIDAAREVARGNRLEPAYLGFLMIGTLFLLILLTFAFDLSMRRKLDSTRMFPLLISIAVVLGAAEGLVALAITRTFDLTIVAREHGTAAIVLRMGAVNGLLGLGLWAMAIVFPFAVRDSKARAAEAEQLRTAAELAHLRANVHPHFIFNTLSTIAGLIGENPADARKLIGVFGDLLRDSLGGTDEMQTIEDEVGWLKRYAGILETRHRGMLAFQWDIADATRSVRIPRFLLQPLLENAVKHGALRSPEGGVVAVRTMLEPGIPARVRCIVEDNGPGPSPARRPGARGIEMVTRRLALKYADAATFRLESANGQTLSIVEVPVEARS